MLGARTFPGNPYDGHILSAVLEQATNLTQDLSVTLRKVAAGLGFRGRQVDADNPRVQIIHRNRYKGLSKQERHWLKRRQTVEPAIGHLKSDHQLDRCWLKGAPSDALHTISCAAGYNLRWLMRAITRLGLGPALFATGSEVLWAVPNVRLSHNSRHARLAPASINDDSGTARLPRTSFALAIG